MNSKYLLLATIPAFAFMIMPEANAAEFDLKRYVFRNVDRSVTALDNGYQLVLSSEKEGLSNALVNNADTRESKSRPRVDKTVNTTTDGITVTKTTDAQYLGNRMSRRATYPKATVYRFSQR